ncbi:zinc-binding dehydrogenase [Streptomyces phaeochromogenes]|uniref:zinc-binding dehydrogenase n=1 Tax=Streptomyces phaeochromogenes TaxID=1923 RepID=UPI002DDC288E|nr:zinc-binding dehydrogenase [Streptomyces phaeochromogenes]WRZ34611.1 zinc-binding dehydrogenase [Streptomyces phaeochromogenes]
MGALILQLAAARGETVIATACPGADFATALTGAWVHLVGFTGDLDTQVHAIAPGGVDAVLRLAGDPAQLAALLRPGGRIASTFGFGPDDTGQDFTAHSVIASANPQTLATLADHAAIGPLRVPVTATYTLEQAPAAFGRGALGKLAVTCS